MAPRYVARGHCPDVGQQNGSVLVRRVCQFALQKRLQVVEISVAWGRRRQIRGYQLFSDAQIAFGLDHSVNTRLLHGTLCHHKRVYGTVLDVVAVGDLQNILPACCSYVLQKHFAQFGKEQVKITGWFVTRQHAIEQFLARFLFGSEPRGQQEMAKSVDRDVVPRCPLDEGWHDSMKRCIEFYRLLP